MSVAINSVGVESVAVESIVSTGGPTYTLTADNGSYTLTGQTAALTAARTIVAAQGSYTLTGQSAALTAGRKLTADQGSYTLTGQDATLTYTPAVTYTMTADHGTYTLTGQAVNLTAQRMLSADHGIYVLDGQNAGLTYVPLGQATQNSGGWLSVSDRRRGYDEFVRRQRIELGILPDDEGQIQPEPSPAVLAAVSKVARQQAGVRMSEAERKAELARVLGEQNEAFRSAYVETLYAELYRIDKQRRVDDAVLMYLAAE